MIFRALTNKKAELAVAAAVVLGCALRFYGVGVEALGIEESVTWYLAQIGAWGEFFRACAEDNTPPLFHLLLKGWFLVFPDTELGIRFLPAFFGSLSVLALYWLGATAYSRSVGLGAAALMAVSLHAIRLSQWARPDSLLVLVGIVSIVFFVRLLRGDFSARTIFGFAISNALGCYVHYAGLLIFFSEALVLLMTFFLGRNRRALVLTFLAGLSAMALYLPWFGPNVFHRMFSQEAFWISSPSFREASRILGFYFGSYVFVGVTAVMFLLVVVRRSRGLTRSDTWLAGFAGGYFLVTLTKSMVSTSLFHPRYFQIFLPLVMLATARLVYLSFDRRKTRAAVIGALSGYLLILFGVAGSSFQLANYEKILSRLGEAGVDRTLLLAAGVAQGGLHYPLRKAGKKALTYVPFRWDEMGGLRTSLDSFCGQRNDCVVEILVSNGWAGPVPKVVEEEFTRISDDSEHFVLYRFEGDWRKLRTLRLDDGI